MTLSIDEWRAMLERGSLSEVRRALRDATEVPRDHDRYGYTLLHTAALRPAGADVLCSALIGHGFDVNVADRARFRQTPLHYAATEGRPALADVLLQAGADVNATDAWDHPPLYRALFHGVQRGNADRADDFLQVIERLLEAGADPAAGSGAAARELDQPWWQEVRDQWRERLHP